jgi:hypothetical protein
MADTHASKYVRPFIGAKELIHGAKRWCLWLVDLDQADVAGSKILRARLDGVRDFRLASAKKTTREGAATPSLFDEIRAVDGDYLAIPRHVGESRHYFPVGHFPADVINGDHNFMVPDPDAYIFGLLSSSMFIEWMRTVSGRIRADLRFSATITWNNFPLPTPTLLQRKRVCSAANEILNVRSKFPGKSLSQLYDPRATPATLIQAHRSLDAEVDALFGGKKMSTSAERVEVLMTRYAELTSDLLSQPAESMKAK